MMKLVKYCEVEETQYISYINEWETTDEKISPYSSARNSRTFEEMLYYWKYEGTDAIRGQGYVPATLYFLVDDDGRIYGAAHLRHELNDDLRQYGGHIGYGIRPSERRKGYSTLQLKMMLDMLKKNDYKQILITCDDDNIGSFRTIEKNGGILKDRVTNHQGIGRRYWINL
ncbi:MAG: GNAT family N-acetyltransferase [Clostridiales bacterium]|nr:GNAT family N-acetyltransferase [Clostridiales bacterium]